MKKKEITRIYVRRRKKDGTKEERQETTHELSLQIDRFKRVIRTLGKLLLAPHA